jgi:hypothetical protein
LRMRVGTEVPPALPERFARERVAEHVLRERLALAPVAGRLGTRHALLQDRLALTLIHVASLPAAL